MDQAGAFHEADDARIGRRFQPRPFESVSPVVIAIGAAAGDAGGVKGRGATMDDENTQMAGSKDLVSEAASAAGDAAVNEGFGLVFLLILDGLFSG